MGATTKTVIVAWWLLGGVLCALLIRCGDAGYGQACLVNSLLGSYGNQPLAVKLQRLSSAKFGGCKVDCRMNQEQQRNTADESGLSAESDVGDG